MDVPLTRTSLLGPTLNEYCMSSTVGWRSITNHEEVDDCDSRDRGFTCTFGGGATTGLEINISNSEITNIGNSKNV